MKFKKTYIGDSVYVDWDGYHVVLTTSDGVYDSNEILLEEAVMNNLLKYYEKIRKDNAAGSGSEGDPDDN